MSTNTHWSKEKSRNQCNLTLNTCKVGNTSRSLCLLAAVECLCALTVYNLRIGIATSTRTREFSTAKICIKLATAVKSDIELESKFSLYCAQNFRGIKGLRNHTGMGVPHGYGRHAHQGSAGLDM